MKILIADSEKDLNNIISKRLIENGNEVESCVDGEAALDLLNQNEYEVILIDAYTNKVNGYEVLKQIRSKGITTPVIMFSTTTNTNDCRKAFDLGANEYLSKPFPFKELVHKIQSVTKSSFGKYNNILRVNDLVLSIDMKSVYRAGQSISVTSYEFDLLEYLMRNVNKYLEKEKIEEKIWYFDYSDEDNAVDTYVNRLINKIDASHEEKLIHKIGNNRYMLKGEKDEDK